MKSQMRKIIVAQGPDKLWNVRIRLPRTDVVYCHTGEQTRATWVKRDDAVAAARRLNAGLGLKLEIE